MRWLLLLALAGCAEVHTNTVSLGGRPVTFYDVATSTMPWAVQHRGAAWTDEKGGYHLQTEDSANLASEIESAVPLASQAASLVQPTIPVK